jgi:hypothetical protein
MRKHMFGILGAAVVTVMLVPAAEAQRVRYVEQPTAMLGLYGTVARPVGEFQSFVDWGGGFGVNGVFRFDRHGILGLRVDGSMLIYGHERYSSPLSAWVPRVWIDVKTDNMIFGLGAGPQLTFGHGPLRPYVFGTAGFSYFATISSVSGTGIDDDFASSTNFDDVALALSAGGGFLVQLSGGRHPVMLDLSAQSTYNGTVDYLTRGDIVENADGSLTLFPIRSEANLVTFRLGVAIGL